MNYAKGYIQREAMIIGNLVSVQRTGPGQGQFALGNYSSVSLLKYLDLKIVWVF